MANHILPFGDQLKPMLVYSSLSDSAFRQFLNHKGIYVSEYSREKIIPLLVSTFISPEEFEFLKSLHKAKEERTKRTTKRIKTKEEVNIVTALEDYKFDSDRDSIHECYHYTVSPEFQVKDGTYQFPYEINRIDRSKDWTDHSTTHTGVLFIRHEHGSLEIEAESQYTSDETREINEKLIDSISTHLKSKDLIDNSEKITYIKFEDFDNSDRFKFLLAFQDLGDGITFLEIDDYEVGPDGKTKDVPSDIEWIIERVNKLILKGKKLEEIDFLATEENYKHLITEKIRYHYSFTIEGHSGECHVSYGFPKILKKLDPMCPFEYFFESLKINWEKTRIPKIEKDIRNTISSQINKIRDLKYQEMTSD